METTTELEYDLGIDSRLARELASLVLDVDFELPANSPNVARPDYSDWTDADYLEYGIWLRALVGGTAEYRSAPYREHYTRATRLGLGPSPDVIVRHLGLTKFGEYKQLLGERSDADFDDLTKRELIHKTAKLSKKLDRRPTARDIERWNRAGRTPSETTIKRRLGSLGNWHEAIGFLPMRELDAEDYLDWGAAFYIAKPGLEINSTLLRELSPSGRAPSVATTYRRFSSMEEFREQSKARAEEILTLREWDDKRLIEEAELLVESGMLPNSFLQAEETDRARAQRIAMAMLIMACLPRIGAGTAARLANELKPATVVSYIVECDPQQTRGEVEVTASGLNLIDAIWPMHRFQNINFDFKKSS